MSDWNKPKTSDLYSDWETELQGRRDEQATLFNGTPPANLPVGAIRFNRTSGRFEEWDGAAWNATTVEVDKLQGKVPADFVPVDGSAPMQGDLDLNGNVIKTADGGSSDVDHIWHDDTTNTWHFCSDTTRQATGNSTLQAGTVKASTSMDVGGNQVWHAGNGGAGSGLDADTLDGNQASAFAAATHSHSQYAPLTSPYFNSAAYVNNNLVWHAGNDGVGSGLDADLLDGQDSTYYRCGGCSWTCSSSCTGSCMAGCVGCSSCTGTCTGSCTSACASSCSSSCTGSCSTSCAATSSCD